MKGAEPLEIGARAFEGDMFANDLGDVCGVLDELDCIFTLIYSHTVKKTPSAKGKVYTRRDNCCMMTVTFLCNQSAGGVKKKHREVNFLGAVNE